MCDDRGGEFFAQIPADVPAKELRAKRETALDAIMDAMENGDQPGEVTL